MMRDEAPRRIGHFVIGKTLGEGGFSKVKLGVDERTGEQVALKLLKSSAMDLNARKQVEGEIRAMVKVDHRNVLKLHAVDYAAKYPKKNGKEVTCILVVLELAKGGELFEFLHATGNFEEALARTYFHQLVSGVDFCHSKNVVHRDLKPENLLFDENFVLKIADFGFSKIADPSNTMYTQCGTPGYMAPEMFNQQGYDAKKADIWAMGVILFIMIAGFPPFQKPNVSDWWFHKLQNQRHDLFWRAHCRTVYFSDPMKDLINKILSPDPASRISLADIMKHPWFMGPRVDDGTLRMQLSQRKGQLDQQKQQKLREEMAKRAMANGAGVAGGFGNAMADVRAMGEHGMPQMPPSMEFYVHGVGREPKDFTEMSVSQSFGSMSLGGDDQKAPEAPLHQADSGGPASYTELELVAPAPVLLARVQGWLQKMTNDMSTKKSVYKVKATVQTDSGPVKLVAQVFRKDKEGETHVVDLTRLGGDGMQFRALADELRQGMRDVMV